MAIRYRLGLILAALSILIIGMFLITWNTTSKQKADGLVINLAGRQRMLSQKMSKEFFLLDAVKSSGQDHKLRADLENTIAVFDVTLKALKNSGKAPLSLNLNGDYAFCPKASEPAFSQLEKVDSIWRTFSGKIKSALKNQSEFSAGIKYVKENNLTLLKEMNKAVGMMQKLSEKKVSRLIHIQTIGVIIGLILAVISFFQIKIIAQKLMFSASVARKMGNGDLSELFPSSDKSLNQMDELAFLGFNLNKFTHDLRKTVKGIAGDAEKLDISSSNINTAVNNLSKEANSSADKISVVSQNADNISQDINGVAAAMEELASNTRFISDSTSRLNDTIQVISDNTDNASRISGEAVDKVDSASSRAGELGKAAEIIGSVSDTITDISDQINLLALNATIEAARAGEAGKGFAVVAGEIKTLATQTSEATYKIKESIDRIQNSTLSTFNDIKDVAKTINEVNELVKNIADSVDDQTAAISEIDTNISESAGAISEISQSIAKTSEYSQSTSQELEGLRSSILSISSNSNEIVSDTTEISGLIANLKKAVDKFVDKFKS